MKATYEAVLFDLDGTLLDSAPDLLHTTKLILKEENRDIPADDILRPRISDGAMGLLKEAFGTEDENELQERRSKFVEYYYKNPLEQGSKLFPYLEKIPSLLQSIPWGIVTNKTRRLTLPIVKSIKALSTYQVLVCGDDLEFMKPHPMPVLHACEQLSIAPTKTLFIGDSSNDIQAGKAAGTATLAATYGYLRLGEDARKWKADYYADSPAGLISMLPSFITQG